MNPRPNQGLLESESPISGPISGTLGAHKFLSQKKALKHVKVT